MKPWEINARLKLLMSVLAVLNTSLKITHTLIQYYQQNKTYPPINLGASIKAAGRNMNRRSWRGKHKDENNE